MNILLGFQVAVLMLSVRSVDAYKSSKTDLELKKLENELRELQEKDSLLDQLKRSLKTATDKRQSKDAKKAFDDHTLNRAGSEFVRIQKELQEMERKDDIYFAQKELVKRAAMIMLEKMIGTFEKRSLLFGSECLDFEKESKLGLCNEWKALGACSRYKDVMMMYCRKTCDLCKPPAPPVPAVPSCAYTKFGCCWDNKTVALGDNGHGCKPCLDRSTAICMTFKSDCHSKLDKGKWMALNCPETCATPCDYNLNVNKCRDDPTYQEYCVEWMQEKKCDTETEKMAVYCRNTCGLCGSESLHGNFLPISK